MDEEIKDPELPPDEYIVEHAYLVGRGVRALALVCTVPDTPMDVKLTYQKLLEIAQGAGASPMLSPIPFVLPMRDIERAQAGFASSEWVVETVEWLLADSIPSKFEHRIRGLLLGYTPRAIELFERMQFRRPKSFTRPRSK